MLAAPGIPGPDSTQGLTAGLQELFSLKFRCFGCLLPRTSPGALTSCKRAWRPSFTALALDRAKQRAGANGEMKQHLSGAGSCL